VRTEHVDVPLHLEWPMLCKATCQSRIRGMDFPSVLGAMVVEGMYKKSLVTIDDLKKFAKSMGMVAVPDFNGNKPRRHASDPYSYARYVPILTDQGTINLGGFPLNHFAGQMVSLEYRRDKDGKETLYANGLLVGGSSHGIKVNRGPNPVRFL
jgi:hypothetical protein